MKFTKMHGIGNDYVYVDCTQEEIQNPGETARFVSDRHFGIGSDGLILIKNSDTADFRMDMYNSDGSQGEMCGNGIRCVAKFVYDKGLTDSRHITVVSAGKIKYLDLTVEEAPGLADDRGVVKKVRVNMGSPVLEPARIPVEAEGEQVVDAPILVNGKEYHMTCVSMGNPHAVIFTEGVSELALEKIGPDFENHVRFPKRTNTEFVEVIDRRNVFMRVWERGTGETLACGTGACAVAVACVLNGLTENKLTVRLLGGELEIEWDRENDLVYMTGPAETVFEGEVCI